MGISRARFLRLAGSGAALSLLSLTRAPFGAQRGSALAGARTKLLAGGRFPIGLWWPPPPEESTARRYAQIARANFNFVIGGNGVNNTIGNNAQALDAAAANGLSFLLTDGGPHDSGKESLQYLIGERTVPLARVTQRLEELLAQLGEKPALAGFNLYDEPRANLFARLGHARSEIESRDGTLVPYVNAWPSYAATGALGTGTYPDYLRALRREVRPPLLCFDHYPLLASGITSDYFYNWAVVRSAARRSPAVPFWGFIQSVGFDGPLRRRRRPSRAEILWQANVALAYGAKGLVHFTYWTPTDPKIKFGNALIDRGGRETELYGYARGANEYVAKVGGVLLPLTSESVVHAGERRLPRGAARMRADGWVESARGSPLILGRFRRSATATDRHLLIVNRSYARAARSRLSFGKRARRVLEFDPKTRSYRKVALKKEPQPRSLTRSIEPGGARLLWLRSA